MNKQEAGEDLASDDKEERRRIRKELQDIKESMADVSHIVEGMSQVVQNKQVIEIWWICNDNSRVLRKSLIRVGAPPAVRSTVCGWKYSSQPNITVLREEPQDLTQFKICPKCVPSKPEDSDSSDTDSSSSGHD